MPTFITKKVEINFNR